MGRESKERGKRLFESADSLPERRAGIYFIACEEKARIKIGKSIDLRTRITAHAHSLGGHELMRGELSLYHVIYCDHHSVGLLEAAAHSIYGPRRYSVAEFFLMPLDPDPRSFGSAYSLAARACEDSFLRTQSRPFAPSPAALSARPRLPRTRRAVR